MGSFLRDIGQLASRDKKCGGTHSRDAASFIHFLIEITPRQQLTDAHRSFVRRNARPPTLRDVVLFSFLIEMLPRLERFCLAQFQKC
jgi:hypothetical protein